MNKKVLAEISLLLVALLWGATFVIVQNAIDILPPLTFNAIRFFIAGVIIFCIYLIQTKGKLGLKWASILPGLLLGLCLFIGYSLQTIGLVYTTPSKAGFITGLSVVMVPILAFILLKKRPAPTAIFGSIAATIGLYLLAVKNTSPFSIGDFYVFLCAFGFAFHIIWTDRFAKRFPVLLLTTVQIFTVSILCTIGALFFEDWQTSIKREDIFSDSLIFAIILTSLFGTAAAFFIQTISQKHTSPTRVAIIFAMEPVFAAVTSYIWIHERLSIGGSIGCALIFIGMIIAELPVRAKIKQPIFKWKKNSITRKL